MKLTLLRGLFLGCIAFTTFFFATQLGNLRIATDLSDLSPDYLTSPIAVQAANKLNDDIQKRLIWLIRGTDAKQIEQATNTAIAELRNITSIHVTPSFTELTSDVVKQLLPYRFQLLSPEQQIIAAEQSAAVIAEQALTTLFQMDASTRLTSFEQDPLGWFSAYLTKQLRHLDSSQTQIPSQTPAPQLISLRVSDKAMEMTQQQQLNQQLADLQARLQQQYAVEVFRSGLFFFASDAAQKSKQDISLISTVSMIGVLILLLLAFRSLWPLVLPFTSIALGVAFALSVVHTIYGAIHVLTIVFGASLIGIVIDYSLHYFYHLSDQDPNQAAQRDHQPLYRALLLSLATSLIGYSALGFSGLEALQKVAVFSCCGLSMAWLSVMCLGSYATGTALRTDKTILPKLLKQLLKPLQRCNSTFYSMLFLLCGALVLLLIGINTSDDPRLFFNASTQLLEEERMVRHHTNDYEPGRYLMIQGQDATEVQQRAASFFVAVDQSPIIKRQALHSLFDWIPTAEQQQNNYALQRKLYQPNGASSLLNQQLGLDNTIAQALSHDYQQAENQQLSPDDLANIFADWLPPFWFSSPDQNMGLVLIHKGANLAAIDVLAQTITGVDYIDSVAATTLALNQQRQSASYLLLLAYVFVALLLVLRYQHWQALTLLSIPMFASLGVLIIFSVTGETITLFHTMALFLVLGLGMDYAIFAHDMQHDHDKTRQAIFVSALTSLLSFGLLSLSDIPVVNAFGLTLLIGNSLNLLGALRYSLRDNHRKTLSLNPFSSTL